MRQVFVITLILGTTAFPKAWAGFQNGNYSRPPVGPLNHTGTTACALGILERVSQDPLGDLRAFEGDVYPVFFRSTMPHPDRGQVDVEYTTDVRSVANRDAGFRNVVGGMIIRAWANGIEQEVGALSFVAPGERITVYFSSRSSNSITPRHHRFAMDRFLRKMRLRVGQLIHEGRDPADFSIERFHTHPTYANVPHSGPDVLDDARFDQWMRTIPELKNMRFRSYVIPLFYGGELYFEFEPQRHLIF